MGLLSSLFGKKSPEAEIPSAEVYMRREYVNKLLLEQLYTGKVLLITFFRTTQELLTERCTNAELRSNILQYTDGFTITELNAIRSFLSTSDRSIFLAERYPLSKKETDLIQQLRQSGISHPVYGFCALDDEIIMRFGGERVIKLMQNMGMSETEVIRHDMITTSIRNAQNKTLKKVNYEQQAKSPEEWYRLNLQQS